MWRREALSEGIDRRQLAWGLGLTGPSVCDVNWNLSAQSPQWTEDAVGLVTLSLSELKLLPGWKLKSASGLLTLGSWDSWMSPPPLNTES